MILNQHLRGIVCVVLQGLQTVNCLIWRGGGGAVGCGIVTLTAWVLVSLLSLEGKQIVVDAWVAFCCRCWETTICLSFCRLACVVEKGSALIGAGETVSDHLKASVFGVAEVCVNDPTKASGGRDEAEVT